MLETTIFWVEDCPSRQTKQSLCYSRTMLGRRATVKEAGSRNNEAVAVAFAIKASDSREALLVPELEVG
jgi:hypothetical protein